MLMDWDNPPSIGCPRYEVRRQICDREKLARAKHKQRGGHKMGKNHSTSKRAAHQRRAQANRLAAVLCADDLQREAYHKAVRAYWTGERPTHP